MVRYAFISVCVATLTSAFVLGELRANGDDVLMNAAVAHSRLKQLSNAVATYLNDNDDYLDDPSRLFPNTVPNTLTFWHPGDDNPSPVTIDNSVPNQPNSAQVSFLFRTGNFSNILFDDFIIWDSSPANNGGQFFSMVTYDGLIETIPPAVTPVPTKVSLAQAHLQRFARAINIYANDYEGYAPDDILHLYGGYVGSPRTFWNPGDSDPMPGDITNSVPNAPNSANISFDYLVAGLLMDDLPLETILLRDNSPANNAGLGINVVRLNGRVELIISGIAGDADENGCIDLADWAKFQRCFGGWGVEIDDDTCRILDFNRDGSIDMEDLEGFAVVLNGPCIPVE